MLTSRFTIGIEEEFQSVDAHSGELRSSIATFLDKGRDVFGEKLHTEWAQSMIELITGICPDIEAARAELYQTRSQLAQFMQPEGLFPISAGTHPISLWKTQEQTDKPRYRHLEHQYQDVIRMRVVFGLHIHIGGVEDQETALLLINQLRTWLPHLLALSSNSPFWEGRFTGMKSYRSIVWQSSMPRSGLQDIFPTLADFNHYLDDLLTMQCISCGKDLWWYVRPHLTYNTIEFRICDMPATIEDSLALAALCQALVAKLAWLQSQHKPTLALPRHYIDENLWQATRYGLDATYADFSRKRSLSMRASLHETLDFVEDVIDDLGSRREIDFLRALIDDPRGTGADRQIAAYERNNDLQDVINLLRAETLRELTSGTLIPSYLVPIEIEPEEEMLSQG
jgi:glutamate---cysteine ligase / carboxylate-amine ligase